MVKRTRRTRNMAFHNSEPIEGRIGEYGIFFDTESWVKGLGAGLLRLGVAQVWCTNHEWDSKKWVYCETLEFYDIEAFIALLSRYNDSVCIAHNTGHDYQVLGLHKYRLHLKRGTSLYSLDDKGPFVYTPDIPGVSGVSFIDLCNWFTVKLAVIGQGLGYNKIDLPPDKMDMTSDTELLRYCSTDVEILRRAYFSICEIAYSYNTNPGISAASMSKNIYLTTFLPKWRHFLIRATRKNESRYEPEILAYFGGRTEALYKGPLPAGFTIYKYDINSHYPAAMREPLPIRKLSFEKCGLGVVPEVPNDSIYRLYHVVINITRDNPYWILGGPGIRREHQGGVRILYAVGRYSTFLWQDEYRVYREMGCIERVDKIYTYDSEPILREFADHFYEKRAEYKKEGNKAYDLVCKLIMNSLYGKFGQKRKGTWDPVKETSFADAISSMGEYLGKPIFGCDLDTYGIAPDGVYKYIPGTGEPAHGSIMSIAGTITAIGRARLLRCQKWIIDNGGNVYYGDTDSVVSDIELPSDMVSSTEMGKFKLEVSSPSNELDIQCRKHYIFGGEIVVKGVTRKGGDGVYYATTASSLRVQYRNVSADNPAVPGHIIKEVPKLVSGKNNCRVEPENGGWTEPIEINDDVGISPTEEADRIYKAASSYFGEAKRGGDNT